MARFQYQATQSNGRLAAGEIEAHSVRAAFRELRRRGVQPTAIAAAAAAAARAPARARLAPKKARRSDFVYVLKELHALVAGGVPVAEAVAALEQSTEHPALATAYGALHQSLRRGDKFFDAFRRAFPVFPVHVQRVIEAGEMTGRLGEALKDAGKEMEHEAQIRAELRNALLYPAFMVGFGVLAVLFIFMVVVPRFGLMFQGKYDKLPLLSYVVIAGGMWVHEHLLISAVAIAAIAFSAVFAFRRPETRLYLRDALTRLPIVKNWLIEMETARWAAVLARLLENRVPLIQSLELARTALWHEDIQTRLVMVERGVRAGGGLAAALESHRFLPATALSLVRVGERSGSLPEMVRSVAEIYDEILHNRIKAMLSIIQPVAIVLIGGVIGLVAIAIFMAITSINNISGI